MQTEPDYLENNYNVLTNYVNFFETSYLNNMAAKSAGFRGQIKKTKGKDRKSPTYEEKKAQFISDCVVNHKRILDLAYNSYIENRSISEEEVKDLVEVLAVNQAKNDGYVDYNNETVKNSMQILVSEQTELYREMLIGKINKGTIEKVISANNRYYDAMLKTINEFLQGIARGEMNKIKKELAIAYRTTPASLTNGVSFLKSKV